jgi:hypothetical protein
MDEQLPLFDKDPSIRDATTSNFSDNLGLPVNRWFRYSAGFFAPWARSLIAQEKTNGRSRVFDPFVGSGTVLLESEACNMERPQL